VKLASLLVVLLSLTCGIASAAPTIVTQWDVSSVKPGQVITQSLTASLPATDTAPLTSTLTVAMPKGSKLYGATGSKGTIAPCVITLDSTDAAGTVQPTVTVQTLPLPVALAIPNPNALGKIVIPLGVLTPGGDAAIVSLQWIF